MTPLGDEHCHETISGGLVIFLTTVGRQGTPSYQLGFHLHLEAVTPLQNLTNLKDRIKTRPAFCFISLNANNSYCNLTHQQLIHFFAVSGLLSVKTARTIPLKELYSNIKTASLNTKQCVGQQSCVLLSRKIAVALLLLDRKSYQSYNKPYEMTISKWASRISCTHRFLLFFFILRML